MTGWPYTGTVCPHGAAISDACTDCGRVNYFDADDGPPGYGSPLTCPRCGDSLQTVTIGGETNICSPRGLGWDGKAGALLGQPPARPNLVWRSDNAAV